MTVTNKTEAQQIADDDIRNLLSHIKKQIYTSRNPQVLVPLIKHLMGDTKYEKCEVDLDCSYDPPGLMAELQNIGPECKGLYMKSFQSREACQLLMQQSAVEELLEEALDGEERVTKKARYAEEESWLEDFRGQVKKGDLTNIVWHIAMLGPVKWQDDTWDTEDEWAHTFEEWRNKIAVILKTCQFTGKQLANSARSMRKRLWNYDADYSEFEDWLRSLDRPLVVKAEDF